MLASADFQLDHEHGEALVDRPFDEALRRVEVENVEAVDPGREDEQRRFVHLLRRRLVLDELVERRLVDDLARRGRDVAAQLERAEPSVWVSWPLSRSASICSRPAMRFSPVGLDRPVDHQRIGEGEIGRARPLRRSAAWRSAASPSGAASSPSTRIRQAAAVRPQPADRSGGSGRTPDCRATWGRRSGRSRSAAVGALLPPPGRSRCTRKRSQIASPLLAMSAWISAIRSTLGAAAIGSVEAARLQPACSMSSPRDRSRISCCAWPSTRVQCCSSVEGGSSASILCCSLAMPFRRADLCARAFMRHRLVDASE